MKILTEKELTANKICIIDEVINNQLVDVHVRINDMGYLHITSDTNYTALNVDIQSYNSWDEAVDLYYESLETDDELTKEQEDDVNQLMIDITLDYVDCMLDQYFDHKNYVKECEKMIKTENLEWAKSLENSNSISNLAATDEDCDYFYEIQSIIIHQVKYFSKSIMESIEIAFTEIDEDYSNLKPTFKIRAKELVINRI